MQSAGRGSTSPGLELPSVRLADPDRAVLRAGLVGPDRVRLPLAVGAGAAIYVDVPRRGQARTPLHTLLRAGQSPKARLRVVQLLVAPTELRKNLQTVSKDRCLRIRHQGCIKRLDLLAPGWRPERGHQGGQEGWP